MTDDDVAGGLARIDAAVFGRVQGVGFRWFVLDVARDLDLAGWVANEADGSVRCVAEGPRPALEALLASWRAARSAPASTGSFRAGARPSGTLGRFEIRSGAHPGD